MPEIQKNLDVFKSVIIKENEIGLLMENGQFKKILQPGKYTFWSLRAERKVHILDTFSTELAEFWAVILLKKRPAEAAKLFEVVETGADQIALLYQDNKPVMLLKPWQKKYFWKMRHTIDVEYISIQTGKVLSEEYRTVMEQIRPESMVVSQTIGASHIGLMYIDDQFDRVLYPGVYSFWKNEGKISFERYDCLNRASNGLLEKQAKELLAHAPDEADKLLEVVTTKESQVAVVSWDEKPFLVLKPWQTKYYFKKLSNVHVDYITIATGQEVPKEYRAVLEKLDTGQLVQSLTIAHFHTGLMFVDGKLVRELKPGAYSFWQNEGQVAFQIIDLRPQQLEVTAQEILTKDKISLRVTLSAFMTVRDACKTVESSVDHNEHLYRLVQFAVREAVGNRSLDEVLGSREKVDSQIVNHVREHMGDIGISLEGLGIKDIILPGEMRDMLNKVVMAEKTAQANLIRRREETAATRSLLNTAKLMDGSPTLMRLKELETLEKLTEKVGRIDLHAGDKGGLDALLSGLLKSEKSE